MRAFAQNSRSIFKNALSAETASTSFIVHWLHLTTNFVNVFISLSVVGREATHHNLLVHPIYAVVTCLTLGQRLAQGSITLVWFKVTPRNSFFGAVCYDLVGAIRG